MGRGSSKAGGASTAVFYEKLLKNNATIDDIAAHKNQMQIDKAQFTTNGNSIALQNATIKSGNKEINVTFSSQYEPTQVTKNAKDKITSKIEVRLWQDGNIQGIRTIAEKKTTSLKSAKTQYDEMLEIWKKTTGQKTISFK